jgi:hypothetical protein
MLITPVAGHQVSDHEDASDSESESELLREIRQGRKFTLEEAIARLAGPGAMKGESPVARMQQAVFEIETWLRAHVGEAGDPLAVALGRYAKGSDLLLNNFEQPLVVLAGCCRRILDSDYLLRELVREADVEWGRLMGERPYFDRPDSPAHPDDPYTVESVRGVLFILLDQLAVDVSPA